MELETAHSAIPLQWNEDPSEQLRALRDEVLKQKEFPTNATAAFMAKAWEAVELLPPDCFPPEHAETLTLISRYFYLDGQTQPSIESAARAVNAAVRGKHRNLEMVARARHGIALKLAFDFSGSARELVSAIEIAREAGAADGEAKFLNSLGNTYNDAGLQYEALALFERAAAFFESNGDCLSAWMVLDNAAVAAMRLGEIDQAIAFAERATRNWCGEPRNADEKSYVVQGALTRCQLLIQVDRTEEALEHARRARAIAEDSGIATAREFAALAEAISRFAAGTGDKEAMEQIVDDTDGPSSYWIALDAIIRTYEATGHFDEALAMQQRLLEFTRKQKAEEVRELLRGQPWPEEIEGAARLNRVGREIQKRISGLLDIAINQSLRAGYDHARIFRLGRLTELFTSSLGWSSKRTEQIQLAAKLLDIGSIAVSSELLTKRRNLSERERSIAAEHARFGADLLTNSRLDLLQACVPVVRFHHERWDGGGPEHLAGEDIPIEARVVALCDALDSLTHERPWRPGQSPRAALHTIETAAGTHFDPRLARHFVEWLREELAKAEDFVDLLDAEASDHEYIQVRKRLSQLIREAA
ncbi:MAG: HD domain-containing phosphohydrolase [Burkholderiaceae bacterium]